MSSIRLHSYLVRLIWICIAPLLLLLAVFASIMFGLFISAIVPSPDVVLYIILFVLFIYLLNEKIQHGPDPLDEKVPVSSLPDTFKDLFRRQARA